MARKKKPTLRYFARFKEDFGYIRAVIRNGYTRKYVLTPLVITAEQLTRLDSAGHINQPQSDADHILEGRLREYTIYIWKTVNPLLESGEFDAMPSTLLTTAILNTKKAEQAKREKALEERTEAQFREMSDEARKHGVTLNRLTPKEFRQLTERLQKELTPEEYAALWEMPQWGRDYIAEKRRKAMEGKEDGE